MEPEGSIPHLEVPVTFPYPEPHRTIPCPHPIFWRTILILSSHLRLGLPSGLFPSSYQNRVYNFTLTRKSYMSRPFFFCLDSLLFFLNKMTICCEPMCKLISVGIAKVFATMRIHFSFCCDLLLRLGVLKFQNTFLQGRI